MEIQQLGSSPSKKRKVEEDVKLKDVVDRAGPWHVSGNQAPVLVDRFFLIKLVIPR
jgi:hypothetical protein